MELDDVLLRREDTDFEVKEAQGRDGHSKLPKSFWETYSAMANTKGGLVLLGAKEQEDGSVEPLGLSDARRVQKDLWNTLNNPQRASANILRNEDVQILNSPAGDLLLIRVPRARRQQRPVHAGSNPYDSTYRRNYEGDYRCSKQEVRRMIADAEHDQHDARLLPNYDLSDIEERSVASYRNDFRAAKPDHVWLTYGDKELLEQLGGWRRDRDTGEEGLTLAGLLMFGKLRSIFDNIPSYLLDYQERPEHDDGPRWLDRLTTDGAWPGNLYEFYRRVYPRLTEDLKVPFRLEGGQRRDETPVHEALREALVNALIHADYAGRTGVKITKRKNRFTFRNPGSLRLPPEQVLAGGSSDCRNRSLQKMFQMIGAAEQAGSGYPKILSAWEKQHWRDPLLEEEFVPEERVFLKLTAISLLPQEALDELDALFPDRFRALSKAKRLALATALIEGRVTNVRLQQITDLHSRDITFLLRDLVDEDFLVSEGATTGTYYTLQRTTAETDAKSGSIPDSEKGLLDSNGNLPDSGESLPDSGEDSPYVERESDLWNALKKISAPISSKSRATPQAYEKTLLNLLTHVRQNQKYLTRQQIADLIDRNPETVRKYMQPLTVHDAIVSLHGNPNHPHQAYQASR